MTYSAEELTATTAEDSTAVYLDVIATASGADAGIVPIPTTGGNSAVEASSSPTNIIYIMMDDADFFDVGYNNHLLDAPDAVTPNIDRLRENGRAFSQFYSAAPVCTPTRISVLTGDSPLQVGATHVWPQHYSILQGTAGVNGLSSDVPQLGLLMQDLGIATGNFGKWHVGSSIDEFRHEALGFDTYSRHQRLPLPEGETKSWSGEFSITTEEGTRIEDTDFLDNVHTDELIDFVEENAISGTPFYANFWPLSPHAPTAEPRNFDNSKTNFDLSTDRGKHLAMMYEFDNNIGRLYDTLQEQGVLDETLIVLTSDNGGLARVRNESAWWKLGKAYLYESGIHVPMVAHWPDGIAPNTTNDSVMTTADILPTFLSALGADPAPLYEDISGRSKFAAFTEDTTIEHDPIVWHARGGAPPSSDPRADKTFAYRHGDLKILKPKGQNEFLNDSAYRLYDLAANPEETRNLATRETDFRDRLALLMLEARMTESQIHLLPEETNSGITIPYDPRFSVASRDMTLDFVVTVPDELDSDKNIFTQEGSQELVLRADSVLEWTISGATKSRQPITAVLNSGALEPGEHRVTLSVYGHKSSTAIVDLYVDGIQSDILTEEESINSFWATTSDVQFGDDGLTIRDAKLHALHFYQDELNAIDGSLPEHIFGTIESDILTGSSENEAIFGGSGLDALFGDGGDDILDAGPGADGWQMLDGGTGSDVYRYSREDYLVAVPVGAEASTTGVDDQVVFTDLTLADVNLERFRLDAQSAGDWALRMSWADEDQSGELLLGDQGSHIESFSFADGQVLTYTDILGLMNESPVAGLMTASTAEDTPIILDVLAVASDVDGDSLSVSAITSGTNGLVSLDNSGRVVYAPNADFFGTDSFSYTLSDGNGGETTQVVDVTITPVPDEFRGTGRSESIIGTGGNDDIFGHGGNDFISGLAGRDRLLGGRGHDVLVGGGETQGELDFLYGGDGADIFVLGTVEAGVLYSQGSDIAYVKDFDLNEGDIIQLYGSSSDYLLQNFYGGQKTRLLYQDGASRDIIAVFSNGGMTVQGLSLSSEIGFSFV